MTVRVLTHRRNVLLAMILLTVIGGTCNAQSPPAFPSSPVVPPDFPEWANPRVPPPTGFPVIPPRPTVVDGDIGTGVRLFGGSLFGGLVLPFEDDKPMSWRRYSLSGAQLSIDLPSEPLETSKPNAPHLKESKMYLSYRKGLVIIAGRVEVLWALSNTTLSSDFIEALRPISEGLEFEYETVKTWLNGVLMRGRVRLQGRSVTEVRALLSSRGTSAWLVAALFLKSSATTLDSEAERVINSVELEPKN